MKMEMVVNGVSLEIESEGAVSVRVLAECMAVSPVSIPAAAPAAPAEIPPAVVAAVSPLSRGVRVEPPTAGDLFSRLSALRRELAVASGVPPYVIFKDQTLRDMAEQKPKSLDEMGSIPGVGQIKLEKFGNKFLSVIRGVAA